MLTYDSLRRRIHNRMREGVGGDRHADAIGRHPTSHNRGDGDLIAYFDIAPSHADDSGAAGGLVKGMPILALMVRSMTDRHGVDPEMLEWIVRK
jgi:hypothetical protein